MNNLITDNLNLVHFVIKKMNLNNSSDYEDYYQIGVIGLIYASNTYNSKLNITFSTYAYVCIKNEILKYLKKILMIMCQLKMEYLMKLELKIC